MARQRGGNGKNRGTGRRDRYKEGRIARYFSVPLQKSPADPVIKKETASFQLSETPERLGEKGAAQLSSMTFPIPQKYILILRFLTISTVSKH